MRPISRCIDYLPGRGTGCPNNPENPDLALSMSWADRSQAAEEFSDFRNLYGRLFDFTQVQTLSVHSFSDLVAVWRPYLLRMQDVRWVKAWGEVFLDGVLNSPENVEESGELLFPALEGLEIAQGERWFTRTAERPSSALSRFLRARAALNAECRTLAFDDCSPEFLQDVGTGELQQMFIRLVYK
ncbi:hypothetical protein BV25DRAFT_169034 [Artomyces pyxidatus]|uniref:Uncharacterized protein n=1 Tax=Artomyces pyxidatus TaxID=48021 RepID=A0ACB8SGZ9_9AGAM|nr:hypothetical protein BV25DRAFT_169034 [Artomyces pyxidatus]